MRLSNKSSTINLLFLIRDAVSKELEKFLEHEGNIAIHCHFENNEK
jgi:hypothetical protein